MIGHAREEFALHPWLDVYIQDGHAYVGEPGKQVHPLDGNAPPFTLPQTTDLPAEDGPGPHLVATRRIGRA
jgi:hypothetical protein